MTTEEIIETMASDMQEKALDRYSLPSRNEAMEKIAETWYENKSGLISILSKHPNWNPNKFQIVLDTSVEREIDGFKVTVFFDWVYRNMPRDKVWANSLHNLKFYPVKEIDERMVKILNAEYPELKLAKGQKTTRAVNKILRSLGFAGREYEQEYAKYADALSPLQVTRHTVLSVHPVDYLLMSNGNSWTSCHTINKLRSNDGYNGCRTSGTLSYMLDGTSMVFYQVDESYTGEDYEEEPKIIRQMFHYDKGILIQGRLYPQCNDGKNSLYTPHRTIVQKILADCTGVPNLWRKKAGTETCRKFIEDQGTNYPDYLYQNECSVSRLFEFIPEGEDRRTITIGHNPICPLCGSEHKRHDWLYCRSCGNHTGDGGEDGDGYICADCGQFIEDEENVYWIGDQPYCEDCVTYCDCCEEYNRNEDVNWYENLGQYVCDECLREYYEDCDCGHWEQKSHVSYDIYGNSYCDDCIDTKCTQIGENWYPNEEVKYCPICGKPYVGEGDYCEDCEEEAENEK